MAKRSRQSFETKVAAPQEFTTAGEEKHFKVGPFRGELAVAFGKHEFHQ